MQKNYCLSKPFQNKKLIEKKKTKHHTLLYSWKMLKYSKIIIKKSLHKPHLRSFIEIQRQLHPVLLSLKKLVQSAQEMKRDFSYCAVQWKPLIIFCFQNGITINNERDWNLCYFRGFGLWIFTFLGEGVY